MYSIVVVLLIYIYIYIYIYINFSRKDPFAKTVPDHVDSVLAYGVEDATVCCFDRRGTYLAVGYTTGVVVIWDFITRYSK